MRTRRGARAASVVSVQVFPRGQEHRLRLRRERFALAFDRQTEQERERERERSWSAGCNSNWFPQLASFTALSSGIPGDKGVEWFIPKGGESFYGFLVSWFSYLVWFLPGGDCRANSSRGRRCRHRRACTNEPLLPALNWKFLRVNFDCIQTPGITGGAGCSSLRRLGLNTYRRIWLHGCLYFVKRTATGIGFSPMFQRYGIARYFAIGIYSFSITECIFQFNLHLSINTGTTKMVKTNF